MPATEWGWLVEEDELDEWTLIDDEEITLINKPGHLVCHPSKNGPCSSLVGAYKEIRGHEKAHLVSRLDRETSGIVLFAKKRPVSRALQMALQHRRVQKTYLAILEGRLEESQFVDAAIGPDKKSVVHCKNTVKEDGKRQSAQTRLEPLYSSEDYTLAKIEPLTGRKHQIRVHAQFISHPIVGDKLYGPDEFIFLDFIETGWTDEMAQKLPLNRQALHAYQMKFTLEDGEEKLFTAP
ncbi:MAG: RNA pseudouridine synthase, partial [Verrucomicrobiota bacterium]